MGWIAHPGVTVTDTGGVRYRLTHPVAPAGGQGQVWATEAEGVAIKISLRSSAEVDARIKSVARLDIHDLPVAAPRRTLEPPAVGYAMGLVTGVQAIGHLGPTGPFTMVTGVNDLAEWFKATGGLRKRLKLIAALADVLHSLHCRGLIYGDLNGGNVLVSEAANRSRLYLIDLDNVTVVGDPPQPFHNPPYTAPEFAQTGATQASDRFSLAVLAWGLLTTKHPHYGRALDHMPPEELRRPWSTLASFVDHPDDSTNRPKGALDRTRVLSPRLRDTLTSVLALSLDASNRPPASRIGSAARSAYYAVADCTCGWQNYVTAPRCYNCDRRLTPIRLRLLEAAPDGSWQPFDRASIFGLGPNQTADVDAATLGLADRDDDVLRLTAAGGSCTVETLSDDLVLSASRLEPSASIEVLRPGRVPLRIVRCAE